MRFFRRFLACWHAARQVEFGCLTKTGAVLIVRYERVPPPTSFMHALSVELGRAFPYARGTPIVTLRQGEQLEAMTDEQLLRAGLARLPTDPPAA